MSKIDLSKYTKVKTSLFSNGQLITEVIHPKTTKQIKEKIKNSPKEFKKVSRRVYQESSDSDQELSEKLAPLTLENVEKLNEGTKSKLYFQFGCYDCQKFFWAKVYIDKPVSRHLTPYCLNPDQKWDKLPKEEVFGKEHKWTSPNSQYGVKQPCLSCGVDNTPLDITGSVVRGRKRSSRTHQCEKCLSGDCRKHRDQVPEYRHISTGSTRSTISDQDTMSNYDSWSKTSSSFSIKDILSE